MKKKKKTIVKKSILLGGLAAVTLIGNIVLATTKDDISKALGASNIIANNAGTTHDINEVYEEGYNVSVDVGGQGSVLLKNANNTLPLAEGAKVTLLGACSYNYVLGGTGSAGGADDEATVLMKDAMEEAGLDVNADGWAWLKEAVGGGRNKASKYANNDGVYFTSGTTNNNKHEPSNSTDWFHYGMIHEFAKTAYEDGKTALTKSGYTNYAIVTFSRSGAEGASPTMDIDGANTTLNRTILELSDEEKDLLKFCKENYSKTIVLINSAAAMELGFLDQDEYRVDACLWIGHPGEAGITGVATTLSGRVNPSGALVDTFAYDMSTMPSYFNNDNNAYSTGQTFYQYDEGIYVGYRWYETAAAAGYFDSDSFKTTTFKGHIGASDTNRGSAKYSGYDQVVQFPFGYGLSYTNFEQEITSSNVKLNAGEKNSVTVKVTNKGNAAGKEVVQLYMEAPYATDKQNFGIKDKGLEKSKVVLVGFAKTDNIAVGASQTVTIEFATDDLASFDNYGQGCYVLENGEYKFNIQDNAHCWEATGENAYYDSVSVTLNTPIIYKPQSLAATAITANYVEKRDSDKVTALNAMDDVTAGDGSADTLATDGYLSRSDFATGMKKIMLHESNESTRSANQVKETPSEAVTAALNVTGTDSYQYKFETYINGVKKEITETIYGHGSNFGPQATTTFDKDENGAYRSVNDDYYSVKWDQVYYVEEDADGNVVYDQETGDITTYTDPSAISSGKYHKLNVKDMSLVPGDSEVWDQLASMTSIDEALTIQGNCGWKTEAVESVGKEWVKVLDGPGEPGNANYKGLTWFPCAVMIAATWNTDLANEVGEVYGHQNSAVDLGGAYAPAMNTHRTPFGGRNFEYYSEDGFIAGQIGGAQCEGIEDSGISIFPKHFGLNDNDTNRGGNCTWANEQAIREIYSRPYEITIKEHNVKGIMMSLNRVGMSWAHYGHYVQMTRNEWGFKGLLITDGDGNNGDAYNNPYFWLYSQGAMLGNDAAVSNTTTVGIYGDAYQSTKYGQYLLQKVMKYCLYQYSSSGMIVGTSNTSWMKYWTIGNVVLGIAIAGAAAWLFIPLIINKKKDKEEA